MKFIALKNYQINIKYKRIMNLIDILKINIYDVEFY